MGRIMTDARTPDRPETWWRRVPLGDVFVTLVSLLSLAAFEIVQLVVLWAIAAVRIPYNEGTDFPEAIARRQLTLALALLAALNAFEAFAVWRGWRRRRSERREP